MANYIVRCNDEGDEFALKLFLKKQTLTSITASRVEKIMDVVQDELYAATVKLEDEQGMMCDVVTTQFAEYIVRKILTNKGE